MSVEEALAELRACAGDAVRPRPSSTAFCEEIASLPRYGSRRTLRRRLEPQPR